ncbi:hypothetical protein UlMin_036048 [Ulmus minor]
MRTKAPQLSLNVKILLSLFFLFLTILIIRSNFSYSKQNPLPIHISNSSSPETEQDPEPKNPDLKCPSPSQIQTCTKAPPSLANAIIHYASTNITPQQTFKEISISAQILEKKSPCNFLVFGLGHDSLMWTSLNYGGRTVFLEEDKAWIEKTKDKLPGLEVYHVSYETKVHEADELMKQGTQEECKQVSDPRLSKCQLALKNFPSDVYDVEWDLIMVDAPTGYFDGAPGRMTAIYTAGLMGRNREEGETHVFVHDVDRVVEDNFSKAFLCEGYLTEQEGRIRHFTIPSHRARLGRPFCP